MANGERYFCLRACSDLPPIPSSKRHPTAAEASCNATMAAVVHVERPDGGLVCERGWEWGVGRCDTHTVRQCMCSLDMSSPKWGPYLGKLETLGAQEWLRAVHWCSI